MVAQINQGTETNEPCLVPHKVLDHQIISIISNGFVNIHHRQQEGGKLKNQALDNTRNK